MLDCKGRLLIVALLVLPLVLVFVPLSWFDDTTHSLCLWRNITGHSCYGCGMTRAFLNVLHLNFAKAVELNRAIVVVFPLLTWLWGRWVWSLAKDLKNKR